MQLSQILQICHLLNANVFIFLICQILMEYFRCLKLWVLVDVSQWVILTETQRAIKFWQGPKKPSLWWDEGFTLRAVTELKTKRHTDLFVFWHNCFPRPCYHWNVSWFPTKGTDLRCLHSKSDCHLCCCFHYHICSGFFLNTVIWSYPQNMQYCTQASTLEKINYYTCMHKLSSFSLMIHHTADCIYKCRLSF